MMFRSLPLLAALLAPSLVAAHPATIPQLHWRDCGDGLQCASAAVPLDHDKPRGDTIGIALIRKPAPDPASRIGSLFVNPGGPGGSGIEFIRTAPPGALDLLSRFDVIGFDPRGRGASTPAVSDCGADPSLARPLPTPLNIDRRGFIEAARRYGRDCLEANRTLLQHLGTANVARDLDLLRAAVGDDKLNYVGISYGGVIGATYASLFPGRARAMLLDSPIDVGGYYRDPLRQWGEYAAGHEDTLQRFLAACAANAVQCGFGNGDPAGAFERLLARLDHQPVAPVTPQTPDGISGDHVRMALENVLRSPRSWPALATALRETESGDGSGLLRFRFGPQAQDFGPDAFQTGVVAVDQQFPNFAPKHYFELAERAYARYPHFWYTTGAWNLVQALWPARDQDAFRGRIHNPAGAAPILVVGITHDPATPYVQQQRLTSELGNARLLTLDGDGHGALTSFDGCVLGHAIAYLETLALPAPGTACVQAGGFFPQPVHRAGKAPARGRTPQSVATAVASPT